MIIEQKFQTIKGAVTIKRVYKNQPGTQVEVIANTFVDAPFTGEYIQDLIHRWAASAITEDRLQHPPQQILALIGRVWSEIVDEN